MAAQNPFNSLENYTLINAIKIGNIPKVQESIENGADPDYHNVLVENLNLDHPLFLAIDKPSGSEIVKLLVPGMKNLDFTDRHNNTALIKVANHIKYLSEIQKLSDIKDKIEIMRILLLYGATVFQSALKILENVRTAFTSNSPVYKQVMTMIFYLKIHLVIGLVLDFDKALEDIFQLTGLKNKMMHLTEEDFASEHFASFCKNSEDSIEIAAKDQAVKLWDEKQEKIKETFPIFGSDISKIKNLKEIVVTVIRQKLTCSGIRFFRLLLNDTSKFCCTKSKDNDQKEVHEYTNAGSAVNKSEIVTESPVIRFSENTPNTTNEQNVTDANLSVGSISKKLKMVEGIN